MPVLSIQIMLLYFVFLYRNMSIPQWFTRLLAEVEDKFANEDLDNLKRQALAFDFQMGNFKGIKDLGGLLWEMQERELLGPDNLEPLKTMLTHCGPRMKHILKHIERIEREHCHIESSGFSSDHTLMASNPSTAATAHNQPTQPPAQELSDAFLLDLSNDLGNKWDEVGTYLEMKQADIDKFRAKHPGEIGKQAQSLLIAWRDQTAGDKDKRGLLASALKRARLILIAENHGLIKVKSKQRSGSH